MLEAKRTGKLSFNRSLRRSPTSEPEPSAEAEKSSVSADFFREECSRRIGKIKRADGNGCRLGLPCECRRERRAVDDRKGNTTIKAETLAVGGGDRSGAGVEVDKGKLV